MGRHHKIAGYYAQMERLREICPDVGLSTDLIVGFPTETEEDFQMTLGLLDRVRYDNVYAFTYSPRPGTRAAKLPDDVPDQVKNERLNRLLAHQTKIAEKNYAAQIGRELEVLVEGESKNQNHFKGDASATSAAASATGASAKRVWNGRTSCGRVVNFASDSPRSLVGRFVTVRVTGATSTSLKGELIAGTDENPLAAEQLGLARGGSDVSASEPPHEAALEPMLPTEVVG
jgi:tRNA-2-methylthio-N6-dimethylallyladenosine synthase